MRRLALLVLVSAACDHSAPFAGVTNPAGPFDGQPQRLTFSAGPDELHGFTSDGSAIFYTYCDDRKADGLPPCEPLIQPDLPPVMDRCFGAIPAIGGGRLVEWCGTPARDADSLKQYRGGTRLADGSVVFIYDARRVTASFSSDPALYILRPGQFAPVRLITYPDSVRDAGIPTRIFAAGGQRVVTLGGYGAELVTIRDDETVVRTLIPELVALDPGTGEGLVESGGELRRVNLESGATQPFAAVPHEAEWLEAVDQGFGYAAGRAVVAQFRVYLVGTTTRTEGRVLLLSDGGEVQEVMRGEGLLFGRLAMPPDGRSFVGERGGDLFRYELP